MLGDKLVAIPLAMLGGQVLARHEHPRHANVGQGVGQDHPHCREGAVNHGLNLRVGARLEFFEHRTERDAVHDPWTGGAVQIVVQNELHIAVAPQQTLVAHQQ